MQEPRFSWGAVPSSRAFLALCVACVGLATASTACTGSKGAAAPSERRPKTPASVKGSALASLDLPAPYDLHYGIYLNGQKVGWMRSRLQTGARVVLGVEMRASVTGMGQVQSIVLEEQRTYDAADGRLMSLDFSQRAATGGVKVRGHRRAGHMHLTIHAGGATSEREVEISEGLQDALALVRLAREPVVGKRAKVEHFDPSLLRTLTVEHRVEAVEARNLGGVETRTVKVVTGYPELGITEAGWLDASGKVLESRIGGFFVARLEPAEVAKQLSYQQDLLVSSVVRAPRLLEAPHKARWMRLSFSGFGAQLPPVSMRQSVKREGNGVVVELKRLEIPTGVPINPKAVDDDLSRYVEATPFIQSDAPAIMRAATKAAKGSRDVAQATHRLSRFVFEHVQDEYVPAYSNALEALTSMRGDCTEHSVLFVALARALGIPARVAVGIAYWPPGEGFGWHAWAEVHAAGQWYAVDPTWNQTTADATHVKLADGGPAEQARIVMLLGQLQVTDMRVN